MLKNACSFNLNDVQFIKIICDTIDGEIIREHCRATNVFANEIKHPSLKIIMFYI